MYVGRGRSVGRLSLSGKAFFFARSSHRYGGCTKLAAAATQLKPLWPFFPVQSLSTTIPLQCVSQIRGIMVEREPC